MNQIFAIIGPPASGKTTLVKQLKKYGIAMIVSHTTRPPKKDEVHGVDYYFVNKDQFMQLPFIERGSYADHFYGISRDEVLTKVDSDSIVVVDIDIKGLEQLKKLLGKRVQSIFVLVDKDTIVNRFIADGNNAADVKRRIEYAEKIGEFDNWQVADHVVKNTGSIDITIRQILAIMGLMGQASNRLSGCKKRKIMQ